MKLNCRTRNLFTDISAESLETIIGFMYTGNLRIAPNTAPNVLRAAVLLEIPTVVGLCRKYLENPMRAKLSAENAVESRRATTRANDRGNSVEVDGVKVQLKQEARDVIGDNAGKDPLAGDSDEVLCVLLTLSLLDDCKLH